LFHSQQKDLDDNERQLESTKSQIEGLKASLKSPDMSPTQVVMSRPDFSQQLQQYATQIGDLNARLIRVKSQAPATGPMPKDIQGQIDELERQINMTRQQEVEAKQQAAEAKEVETVVENPRRRDADARLSTLSLTLTQLQTDGDVLSKQFEKTKALYVRLNDLESRYDEIVRRLARADEDRRHAADALANANTRRELKMGGRSSLQQFEAPSLPVEKEGPNRMKLLFGGLFVGVFLGLGVVLLRAVPDAVIREREDIEGFEGVAVIGVLPRLDNRNLRRHRALREQGW
jgi:chromosome segregation ATPase